MTSLTTRFTKRGLPRLLFADGGVARDHVPHLVGEHGGKLGLVVGERDEAARHVELPGWQARRR